MPVADVKDALASLLQQTLSTSSPEELQTLVGERKATALHDPSRDEIIERVPKFENAMNSIAKLPEAPVHYGVANYSRVALQVIHETFGHIREGMPPEAALETAWQDFREEAAEDSWTFLGVAKLKWFSLSSTLSQQLIPLADNCWIERATEETLTSYGVNLETWNRLDDWLVDHGNFGAKYIIVTQSRIPKSPETLVLSNDGNALKIVDECVLAMRLAAAGDVSCDWVHTNRKSHFSLLGGGFGLQKLGISTGAFMGTTYELGHAEVTSTRQNLNRLAKALNNPCPKGLPVGLSYFAQSYSRAKHEDSIVCLMTALESVLGTDVEISYRLSSRIAYILGQDDNSRQAIYQQVKDWYSLRSTLVHGGSPKKRYSELLKDPEPLRAMTRILLRGFLAASCRSPESVRNTAYFDALDLHLISQAERTRLKRDMELP